MPLITRFLDDRGASYTVHKTEKSGHAARLASSLAGSGPSEGTAIVVAGGDGTCNEVINGMLTCRSVLPENKLPVLGVLPIGRGNDFAHGAGLSLNLNDALENIVQDHTVSIDAGWFRGGTAQEGRYFANGVGIGFDAIVNAEAAKIKWFQGYILAALKTIIIYPEAPQVELSYDDKIMTYQPALISFMNGKRLGGAFYMAPDGDMTDGVLNLNSTRQVTRRVMIGALFDYLKGTQKGREDTITLTGSRFRVKALKGSLVIHADGETLSTEAQEVDVHCIPGALELLKI